MNSIILIDNKNPWLLKKTDGTIINPQFENINSTKEVIDNITFTLVKYEDLKNSISGIRAYISIDENISFIYQDIFTSEELCVYDLFYIDNPDGNVFCNIADKHRIVVKNDTLGTKHFRLNQFSDNTNALNSVGLMMPYKITKNNEIIYSFYEGLHTYSKHHTALYGLLRDKQEIISQWHFRTENEIPFAVAPYNAYSYGIFISDNTIEIINKENPSKNKIFKLSTD